MLGKLLKYDFKVIIKRLVIFYSLATIFSILTRVFFSIENSLVMNIIAQICQGAMISMLFSIMVNNIMLMWVRFKSNLYGDESYLTHTLPVTKNALYLSKILCAVITLFVSMIVIVINLFIAYYSEERIEAFKNLIFPIAENFEVSTGLMIFLLVAVLFVQFSNILQCGFMGIILGHRMNNAKTGFSVLYGFIVYMIGQALIVAITFAVALFNESFMNLFVTAEIVSVDVLKTALYISIAAYIVILSSGYIISQKLFKKCVNVD